MELGTPLTFNHFLGRESGDFMSFAHTPARFRQRWLGPRTSVPNLFLCGQDAVAAGVSGAMVGGAIAVSAALGRDVLQDLPQRQRCPQGTLPEWSSHPLNWTEETCRLPTG